MEGTVVRLEGDLVGQGLARRGTRRAGRAAAVLRRRRRRAAAARPPGCSTSSGSATGGRASSRCCTARRWPARWTTPVPTRSRTCWRPSASVAPTPAMTELGALPGRPRSTCPPGSRRAWPGLVERRADDVLAAAVPGLSRRGDRRPPCGPSRRAAGPGARRPDPRQRAARRRRPSVGRDRLRLPHDRRRPGVRRGGDREHLRHVRPRRPRRPRPGSTRGSTSTRVVRRCTARRTPSSPRPASAPPARTATSAWCVAMLRSRRRAGGRRLVVPRVGG